MISGSSSTMRRRLRGAFVIRDPRRDRSTNRARARVGNGIRSCTRRRSMSIGGWIVLAVVVAAVVWVIAMYNGLITLRNRFRNAFSQIDVQLKRRYDLIPNLVETAKGYIKHERETLEAVTRARNTALAAAQAASANPGNPAAMQQL